MKIVPMLLIVLVLSACAKRDPDFFEAARCGDSNQLRSLLASGVDVNARDEAGATALYWSVISGDTNSVQVLVASGAEVDAACEDGLTPILQAAAYGRLVCARILLRSGASITAVDNMGCGFMHHGSLSAGDRDLREVEAVLRFGSEHGLDINQQDNRGLTSLDWAQIHGRKDIESLLRRMGAVTGEEVRKDAQSQTAKRD